ncbi:MAG TPA: hypothetical protein VFW44_03110 [Bryobacteraceae bacterium]|nr:hypothetical protein [Bryobacteraceae bacterium]
MLLCVCAALLGVANARAADGHAQSRRMSRFTVSEADFLGEDVGQRINAAYAALPPTGGEIMLEESGSFSTPVAFTTPGKPVLLTGIPGDVVTLTFTGTGTAMTFDYGTGHRMGHGMRDLTLTGPGNATSTIGVVFGGANGAEGIEFRDFKIQSFGVNLQMGSHTWLANFEHGMVRDGGINVLLPSGLTEAGEQIAFHHVTFADAPPPHTNSVWVQGDHQEIVFRDCSFDQAQLRIGNGSVMAAQVVVEGSHFENPNWSWPESVAYDYILQDQSAGNLLRITDSYFLQAAATGGPDRFVMAMGGRVILCGIGMFSPESAPMRHFAVAGKGASIDSWGFADLSSNTRGAPVGKY